MSSTLSPPAPSDAETPSAGRWRITTFRALRHRNYQLYFIGQIISLTGSWVQSTALTWLAYELTRRSSFTALVSAAQLLPMLGLGLIGGGLADRLPRRPLIFFTQSVFLVLALVLAAMAGFDMATGWALLVIALLIGIVNAVDTPARLAFVIDMVGRDDLVNAIALNSLIFNVARVAGPAIGVLLLGHGHAGLCFLVNGLTFVAVLIALACMQLPHQSNARPPDQASTSLKEAFRYLAARRGLVLLVILGGALAFFGWPLMSLLPALSDKHLHAGTSGYTYMMCAVGAGALVGALCVASLGASARRWSLVVGVLLTILSLLGLAFLPGLPAAVVCCSMSGGGLILFFATGQGLLQLGAGEHNRGRIMGIWLMVLSGATPAGHLVLGTLADKWGVPVVLALAALGSGIAAGAVGVAAIVWRRRT